MARPLFVVPVADLERAPRSVTWVIPQVWLDGMFSGTDATVQGDGTLEVELTKTGREVMVRGQARVSVTLPCVVTLDPLPFELAPEIFLLLGPTAPTETARPRAGGKKSVALRAQLAAPAPVPAAKKAEKAEVRPSKGARRDALAEAEQELSERSAARDTYDGEKVVLDEFVREFVLLELPPYPRRSDLPSEQRPANAPPSTATEAIPAPVDPRLLPLARIKSQLTEPKKE